MAEIPDGCVFYHQIDLPGLGTVPGVWDHRATADPYLGRVDLAGKRVLEIGPANGFFSFELERRGARVTSLELGDDSDWDRVPQPYLDDQALQRAFRANVQAVRSAWSFAHGLLGSKVESVRGTAYEAPQLVDEVDVAFFGNVLQHLRDPLLALSRVATVTKETLIVSETMWTDTPEFRETPCMQFIARADLPEACGSWWNVSPALIVEKMKLLGFPRIRCEYHDQQLIGHESARLQPRMVPHFTVVGSRMAPGLADRAVSVTFGDDWQEVQQGGGHSFRWSKDQRAAVGLCVADPVKVDIAFGVKAVVRGARVTVRLNGAVLWQGATLDICGVALRGVKLTRGASALELEADAPQGLCLFDFGVALA